MAAALDKEGKRSSSFIKSLKRSISASHHTSPEASTTNPPKPGEVIHQGWAVKESGTALFGKTNWRKRWFVLSQGEKGPLLQYFKNQSDSVPAGYVQLNVTYCVRQMETHEKGRMHCIAVGPLADDGATRTYFISCNTLLEMHEWITAIDAAVQGATGKAKNRIHKIQQDFSKKKRLSTQKRISWDHGLTLDTSNMEIENDETEMEDSFLFQKNDGMIYCSVQEEAFIDEIIPEDSISDDDTNESLISQSMDTIREDDKKGAGGGIDCEESHLPPAERLKLYSSVEWRLKHWKELCKVAKETKWYKTDCKDGITISRLKFGRSLQNHAVIKLEGVFQRPPEVVQQFLKISMRPGGKLDYLFRNELQLDVFSDELDSEVIYNEFQVPFPKISKREVLAMKVWVTDSMTEDGTSGLVMFSVDHPKAKPPDPNATRIHVKPSGFIAYPKESKDGSIHTVVVIIVQIILAGGLHRMMKGAYNSGLLKYGLKSTFQHIMEQFKRFAEMTDL